MLIHSANKDYIPASMEVELTNDHSSKSTNITILQSAEGERTFRLHLSRPGYIQKRETDIEVITPYLTVRISSK